MTLRGLLFCAVLTGSVLNAFVKNSFLVDMRDGVQLYTNVYTPSDTTDSPWPAVLIRTPYGADRFDNYAWFLSLFTDMNRYALVIQDTRGRFNSQGVDSVFLDDGWRDGKWDGYDCVEWVAAQDWCDGNVGTYGGSAEGITQYLAAGACPPSLKCAFVLVAAWDLYKHAVMPGGEYREYDIDGWLNSQGSYYMKSYYISHYNKDTAWQWVDVGSRVESVNVPIWHYGGWYDMFCQGTIDGFQDAQFNGAPGARGNQRLLVGPWEHNSIGSDSAGQLIYPANARRDYGDDAFRWFDYWLKGINNGVADTAVQFYLMGPTDTASSNWNKWVVADSWPVACDTVALYLRQGGFLSVQAPGPADTPVSYDYDPRDPVPTVGGNNLILAQGPYDQSSVWDRPDVLVYQTDVLDQDLAMAGNVWLRLFASSNRYDTDFTAKLVDIYPDGRKMLITDGILMARHRAGYDTDSLLQPGEVYEFQVDMWSTAYVWPAGHRLGLAVSSSNHPRFRANPNVADPPGTETDSLVAHNTVFQDLSRPSALLLPVINGWNASKEAAAPPRPEPLELSIAPNPFENETRIGFSVSGNQACWVGLFDPAGRLVSVLFEGKPGPGTITIELGPGLEPGVFYVVARTDHGFVSKQVIKLR